MKILKRLPFGKKNTSYSVVEEIISKTSSRLLHLLSK